MEIKPAWGPEFWNAYRLWCGGPAHHHLVRIQIRLPCCITKIPKMCLINTALRIKKCLAWLWKTWRKTRNQATYLAARCCNISISTTIGHSPWLPGWIPVHSLLGPYELHMHVLYSLFTLRKPHSPLREMFSSSKQIIIREVWYAVVPKLGE